MLRQTVAIKAAALLHPKKHKREVEKQEFRRECQAIGGSARAGYAMLKAETDAQVAASVKTEMGRYNARKAGRRVY
jgi:hypothetical protein